MDGSGILLITEFSPKWNNYFNSTLTTLTILKTTASPSATCSLSNTPLRQVDSPISHTYILITNTHHSLSLSLFRYIYIYIGQQADLALHRDGSLLSFNVLLNPVSDFKGGGTYIKPLNQTFQIKQGSHDNPINNCYNHLYNLMIYDKLFET